MAKENGGVIGIINTPTSTTASGVWALQDQYEAKRNSNWPLTPFVSPNSARFNSGSSDYLNRTFTTPTNRKIFTFSTWLKKTKNGDYFNLFSANHSTTNAQNWLGFSTASYDDLYFNEFDGSSYNFRITTTQLFRDVSAFYHLVVAVDTTQATASNRIKIYVNGTQVTSFVHETYPSQNYEMKMNSAVNHAIGTGLYNGSQSYFLNAYVTETYFIDGQQLTPSSFGASNASGVWYPIPYSGSYGTNGFYLKFGNASSLGTDSSPNGNNWTVNNLTSVDQSTDSTLNNFCTLNPLFPQNDNLTFTNGNLQATKPSGSGTGSYFANFGVSAGKWYWEMKCNAVGGNDQWIGIGQMRTLATSGYPGNDTYCVAAGSGGEVRYNGTTVSSYTMASWTAGDIIMVALDMTNSRVYWGKNGTWQDSGDPVTGTNPYTNGTIFDGNFIFPVGSLYQSNGDVAYNFGAGTTYAANSYADGNGYGNFSYAVPSGYYALCTANLNTYG
jgi:hypothetical protein